MSGNMRGDLLPPLLEKWVGRIFNFLYLNLFIVDPHCGQGTGHLLLQWKWVKCDPQTRKRIYNSIILAAANHDKLVPFHSLILENTIICPIDFYIIGLDAQTSLKYVNTLLQSPPHKKNLTLTSSHKSFSSFKTRLVWRGVGGTCMDCWCKEKRG